MSCNRTRSIAILLILVTLIACANAQPSDGSEGFENMDWSFLASVGGQFSGIMAHDQFAQMTTSPIAGSSRIPIPNRSPPRSHSRTQPAAPTIDDHFGCVSPWAMELPDNLGLGIQNLDTPVRSRGSFDAAPMAAQGQFGGYNQFPRTIDQGRTAPQRAGSWSFTSAPQIMSVPLPHNDFGAIGTPVNTGFVEQPFVQQQHASQAWPPRSVPMQSQPANMYSMQGYNLAPGPQQSLVPNSNEFNFGAQPPTSVPEILSPDVTNNYNFQQSMVPNNVGMLGWIGRAPTTGDRAVPRLNTDHLVDNSRLVPPESNSANRSPTSASTTGSSGGRARRWPTTSNLHCHWCSSSFSTQGDLTHHLRSHAPYMSRQHVCHHCEKRFQYRKDLARHVPKHDPHRQRFYCPIGNCKYHTKGFGRQDHLDRHMGSQHRVEPQREDTPQRGRTPSQ